MKKTILISLGILGILVCGLVVFVGNIIGDEVCDIEIQNNGEVPIIVKTVSPGGDENGWYMIVDSLAIEPNQKFRIGSCIYCTTLSDSNFEFEGIAFSTNGVNEHIVHKKDLPEFLSKLNKINCSTYLIE